MITSTSPRFKKFLSPSILLNFGRNFTKYVINRNPSIFSKKLKKRQKNYVHKLHFDTKLMKFQNCVSTILGKV